MAQNIDREELAMRYVLGTLSEEEKARLDQQYFNDDLEFEELEIAEGELVDRYVRKELSAENSRQLEEVLKRSPRLRERVEFARVLARKASAQTHQQVVPDTEEDPRSRKEEDRKVPWRFFWGGATVEPAPALRLAFATSVVLLMLASIGLIVVWNQLRTQSRLLALEQQQRQEKEKEVAAERNRSTQAENDLKRVEDENEAHKNELAELKQQQLQQPQPQQPSQPSLLAFVLMPTSGTRGTGGATRKLSIPANAKTVQFNLDVGGREDEYPSYVASLVDMNNPGESIKSWKDLQVVRSRRGKFIQVEVPSSQLSAGTYNVRLEGIESSGQTQIVDNFSFRITR